MRKKKASKDFDFKRNSLFIIQQLQMKSAHQTPISIITIQDESH